MASRLIIEPLRADHLPELATRLRRPAVYEHIGGVPSLEEFILDRERALRGPGPAASGERWLDFLVRERSGKRMIGRLEASLHDSIAEVAFLFSPSHWGKGLAFEALGWLHAEVQASHGINSFWASTTPANTRCQSLLLRTGYQPVLAGAPPLRSHDAGDLVFAKVPPPIP